jgi:hypothetical protein
MAVTSFTASGRGLGGVIGSVFLPQDAMSARQINA